MKRKCILVLVFFSCAALHAQITKTLSPTPKLAEGLQIQKTEIESPVAFNFPFKPYNPYAGSNKNAKSLSKVLIGSSANPYGILLQSQNCLTYNDDLGLLMFTHRQTHTNPGNSGYIQTSFSSDNGTTWVYNIVYDALNNKLGRYPSGVIYNPVGNTNINDAFAVTAGPYTDGTAWRGNYYASMQFNNTNGNIQQIDDPNTGYTFLVRTFMTIDTEGRIRIYGEKNTDDGTNYTSYTTVIMTGIYDAVTKSWNWTESVRVPDYIIYNGLPSGYRTPGMAWSKDGQTGYLIYIGRNSGAVDQNAYHPIIYKTVNGGSSWTLLSSIDWSQLPEIYSELIDIGGQPGVKRALFGLIDDAIVDVNGKLHFACMVNSAASSHPDSLGYYWAYQNMNGLIYHIRETATGWEANLIDTILAKDVETANSPIPDVTWDYRLQMSKTPNEANIILAWMDTDPAFSDINLLPDIKIQSYNIITGYRSPVTNITYGTAYYTDNYFLFLSEWSGFDAVTNKAILHMTTSDFGATHLDPSYHYYVKNTSIYVGINEFLSNSGSDFTVSQNYPNPFSDYTSIDIALKKSAELYVEVYNVMGQKISEKYYHLTQGKHIIRINGENLNPGIYYYTVKTAEDKAVGKMIVK